MLVAPSATCQNRERAGRPGRLEVHRDPAVDGYRYRVVTVHRAGETVAPLARPEAKVAVAEVLP